MCFLQSANCANCANGAVFFWRRCCSIGWLPGRVVHQDFAIKIPEGYDLQFAGPVMCAGVTMYDPLVRHP